MKFAYDWESLKHDFDVLSNVPETFEEMFGNIVELFESVSNNES